MKNIKYFLLLLFCVTGSCLRAQNVKLNFLVTALKDYPSSQLNIPEGTQFMITDLIREEVDSLDNRTYRFMLRTQTDNMLHLRFKSSDIFDFQCNSLQDLWDARVITDVCYNIEKYGYQDELRLEMEADALDYIARVKSYGEELDDPQLLDYIHCLLLRMAPERYLDDRMPNLNVLIQQSYTPDAKMFPNGTLVLTTGLLASLHTEDELAAILAHELAHFVLDHNVINVNKSITRQKRQAFWTGALTGLTAVTEGLLAVNNGYELPGLATAGMLALSSSIGCKVVEHLGMKYIHNQETEADSLATRVLHFLGYDTNAMATALNRIAPAYLKKIDNSCLYNVPSRLALQKRIQACGTPQNKIESDFEKKLSLALSNAALLHYTDRHYRQCLLLVNQNIQNQIATSDDYLLKAACLLALYDNPQSNQKTLDLIETAKTLGISTFIQKERIEITAHLRLGHKQEAQQLLTDYLNLLTQALNNPGQAVSAQYINSQIKWAKTMQLKLGVMAQ